MMTGAEDDAPIGRFESPIGYVDPVPREPASIELLVAGGHHVVLPHPWPVQFGEPSGYLHQSSPLSWTVSSLKDGRQLVVHGTSARGHDADEASSPVRAPRVRLLWRLAHMRRLERRAWRVQLEQGPASVEMFAVGAGPLRVAITALRARSVRAASPA